MNKLKYYLKNLQFVFKKGFPLAFIIILVALVVSISGFIYSLDNPESMSYVYYIGNNSGKFTPILSIIFSLGLGVNFYKITKNYNLSIKYSNFSHITFIFLMCFLLSIIFVFSIYMTRVIGYIKFKNVVPMLYYLNSLIIFKSMFATFLYCILASSLSYLIMKLTKINNYFYILFIIYIFLIFYAFSYGGIKYENSNFLLVVMNYIMMENRIFILVLKVIPFSLTVFYIDHLLQLYRGVK